VCGSIVLSARELADQLVHLLVGKVEVLLDLNDHVVQRVLKEATPQFREQDNKI
jgi:hypothetical protein